MMTEGDYTSCGEHWIRYRNFKSLVVHLKLIQHHISGILQKLKKKMSVFYKGIVRKTTTIAMENYE